MTLYWRLTLGVVGLIAPLLLLMIAQDFHNLHSFVLEREGIRLRAQAKPIIDKDLLHQPLDDTKLRALANQLATDLTSADTGAVIVDRHSQVIGRYYSQIGEPAPPELPQKWYAPALAGEREQNYIVTDKNRNHFLVALVPIPPPSKTTWCSGAEYIVRGKLPIGTASCSFNYYLQCNIITHCIDFSFYHGA